MSFTEKQLIGFCPPERLWVFFEHQDTVGYQDQYDFDAALRVDVDRRVRLDVFGTDLQIFGDRPPRVR